MGSNVAEAGRGDDEGLHTVCIRDFSIARYEVTRGEYAEFVRETGRVTPDVCLTYGSGGWQRRDGRSWQNPGYDQGDNHPAVCVSRTDALAYVAWLSAHHGVDYRLPTEAEWEFAARTGTATARPWGDANAEACRWANSSDQTLLEHYPRLVVDNSPLRRWVCPYGSCWQLSRKPLRSQRYVGQCLGVDVLGLRGGLRRG